MPPNNPPTARRQRLGAELRKLRERAGMSAATAAGRLGGNQTQISNIEAGRHGVSADRVRTRHASTHAETRATSTPSSP